MRTDGRGGGTTLVRAVAGGGAVGARAVGGRGMVRMRVVGAIGMTALLAGCGGTVAGRPSPAGSEPGFDTREYPGDETMRIWQRESPYRWVGYYLLAPCHTGESWSGRLPALQAMGWGVALLYVGEQDWNAMAGAALLADSTGAAAAARCTAANLTVAQGGADAAEAVTLARREGFASSSWIYLDVERVDAVGAALTDYVRAWVAGVLEDGRYRPGLYAHTRNADELHRIYTEEFARRGVLVLPRLWVAASGDFNLRRSPTHSGHVQAYAWQGVFNTPETWGGRTLRIDANVAVTSDPSR